MPTLIDFEMKSYIKSGIKGEQLTCVVHSVDDTIYYIVKLKKFEKFEKYINCIRTDVEYIEFSNDYKPLFVLDSKSNDWIKLVHKKTIDTGAILFAEYDINLDIVSYTPYIQASILSFQRALELNHALVLISPIPREDNKFRLLSNLIFYNKVIYDNLSLGIEEGIRFSSIKHINQILNRAELREDNSDSDLFIITKKDLMSILTLFKKLEDSEHVGILNLIENL